MNSSDKWKCKTEILEMLEISQRNLFFFFLNHHIGMKKKNY